MKSSDFPFLYDWLVITFRWVGIVMLAITLTYSRSWTLYNAGVVFLISLWNIAMSILAMLNQRIKRHRIINIGIDFVTSIVLISITGGLNGPIPWAGMLCLFSAAIYYEWYGVLAAISVISLVTVFWSVILNGWDGFPTGMLYVVVYLVTGVIMGLLGIFLISKARNLYFQNVHKQNNVIHRARVDERLRMRTFYDMIKTLSATLNYQTVLETSLDLSYNSLATLHNNDTTSSLVAAVLLVDNDKLRVAAKRNFLLNGAKMPTMDYAGVLANVLEEGKTKIIKPPSSDPEIEKSVSLKECAVALCIPLMRGMKGYGVLVYGHPDPEFFDLETVELLEMISHQAVIAIQNARLFQELEDEKQRFIDTQEEARKQLARQLHDGPTQTISSIAMRLNLARSLLHKNLNEANIELEKAEDLAIKTTKEIRHMLFTLRPLILESEGLIPALEAMAEKMKDTYKQNVSIDADPEAVEKLDAAKQTSIFHIAEEAINNARKHAQAERILVSLKFVPQDHEIILLTIVDNGIGFDMQSVMGNYDRRGSLGMVNLQERTDLMNGLLQFQTKPGEGTRIQVFIPTTNRSEAVLSRGKARKN